VLLRNIFFLKESVCLAELLIITVMLAYSLPVTALTVMISTTPKEENVYSVQV
jgi:hypothetical protein